MFLIVDANVLLSTLVKKGVTFSMLFELSTKGAMLVSPDFVLDEIESKLLKIKKLTKLSETELKLMLEFLKTILITFDKSVYEEFLPEAKEICSDKDDAPYVALSLALGKIPIWSFDKKLAEDCAKIGIEILSSIEEVRKKLV